MNCINKSHPSYKKLLEETGLRPFQLELKVVAWQMANDTDEFPTKDFTPLRELETLTENFVDETGYVFPDYVDHVRSKIKAIGGAWLRSDKKGYYIQTEKHNVVESREVLTTLLDKLSKKFGIEWRFDSTMKAKGRFEGGVVYINPNKATLDTAFHEFAHPFLLVLKKENRALYNRLVRGIKNEKTILERTKKLYPELSEEELLEEAIVESLGRKAVLETKVYGGAITQFIEWVKGIVADLFGQEYSSFKDVAKMLSDEAYEKQLEVNSKTALYQIDESTVEIYRNQLEGKTTQQKEVVERLIAINREVELNDTGDKYVTSDGVEYTRVSDELAKDDYYKFDKNVSEENKALALQWGNEVDGIMRSVLLGQPLEEGTIDSSVAQGIYDEFKKIKESYPDSIIIPQITFLNKKKGVAGTADIVVVHKDGSLEILDVKTSRYKFRKTPDPKALKYADSYNRHAAQLTMYRALAESQGFTFVEQGGLKILPIEFTVSEANEVVGWKRPFDFIEHGGVEKLYEVYREGFEKSQFADVMNNLKQVIQKKINKAKQEGKGGQVKALETILADIRSSIDIEGVNKFVNESYNTFFGTSKFAGYYKIYKDYLNKAQLEDDPLEMLAKIHEIEELMNLYKDSVKELWKSYLNFKELTPLDDFQGDSTLDKLDKLQRMFSDMEQGFQDDIPRVVAKVLAKQVSPNVVEAIKTNIKSKSIDKFKEKSPEEVAKMSFVAKQRYAFQKNQSEKMRKKLNELNEQFVNDKGEVDVEEAIYREIKFGGYKDVGIADRWLSPGISMPNTFLPTFILTMKKAFEEIRLKNMRFIPLAYQQFEKFSKSNKASKDMPHEFNKGLYTKRTVQQGEETKQILTFVSPIDYNAFNINKIKFNEQIKALSGAEKYKAVLKWEAENTQVRPDVHIEGVTKMGNLILIETKTELEERKKKELGEKGFQDWKASVTSQEMLRGEYRIPKLDTYRDDLFFKMDSNQKEYYKFLLTTYFDSQNKVPKRKEGDKFILPYIDKSTNDRLLQGEFWNTLKYKGQDMFMLMEEDMLKENVERNKTIPVLYYNNSNSMDAENVSTDLLHSIMRFKMASDRYSVQNKYVPLANNLLSLVQKTAPAESDTEGFKILDKAAKAVGITNGINKYIKKHEQSNVVAMLESFIDTQIYGIARKDAKFNIGGITVDSGKIADTIMSFASHTQIALDPLTSLANSLNAQIQIAEEAFAGQFVDRKTWWEAQKYYNTHELDFIHDSLQPYNKSFIGTLMDTYDAMQGEYIDEFGHKLTKSAFKAKIGSGIGFSMMHKGEHRAAAIMMIALLNKQKVGDKTLFEIHKEQFEKDGKIELNFSSQTRLHAINKRLHGVYNRFDAPEIQRHALGRLMIMYRKFLAPGLKRRFKNEGLDYELGDYTEGFYRQFYKAMFTDVKKLGLALQNKQGDMTPYELYNIRRAIFEHLMIITTGLMSTVLMSMGGFTDDDDDEYFYGALLYQVLRVNSELSIYGGVGDINNYLLPDFNEVVTPYKATSAAFTTIAKVQKLYSYVMGDAVNLIQGEDIARYKRDSGVFEKGDSKTMAALIKLIGISGKNLSSDVALETLTLTRGIDIKNND